MALGGVLASTALGGFIGHRLTKSDIKKLFERVKGVTRKELARIAPTARSVGAIYGGMAGLSGALTAYGLYHLLKSKEAPIWKGMGIGGLAGLALGLPYAIKPTKILWQTLLKKHIPKPPAKLERMVGLALPMLTGTLLGGGVGATRLAQTLLGL